MALDGIDPDKESKNLSLELSLLDKLSVEISVRFSEILAYLEAFPRTAKEKIDAVRKWIDELVQTCFHLK